jgi:mono/diheme cytochrome c family protein
MTNLHLRIGAIALAELLSIACAHGDSDFDRVQRGKYLVDAGDCVACHTPQGGKPFQGGRALATPFGAIYSANITPDRETGIGSWSADDFYRAMHDGISADGHRLYPAFPYPYYTHVTREDVDDILAYLQTVQPVKNQTPANKLPFPLNERAAMRAWNWMFFKEQTFQPVTGKSATWNRGAYLVEGLGHCGACHTPKNILGGDEAKQAYQGGNLDAWFAPDLGSDLRQGLGGWSEADIFEYLKTGRNRMSNATGPMAEVIDYSTSRLSDDDVHAIATYLKDLPQKNQNGSASGDQNVTVPAQTKTAGNAIFADQCAACHRIDGTGQPGFFPPLKGNANVQQPDPTTIVRVILEGARSTPTKQKPTPLSMPAFNWKLTDAQVAAVATYIRNSWGNVGSVVPEGDVRKLRSSARNAER